jgi:hypothetical protein
MPPSAWSPLLKPLRMGLGVLVFLVGVVLLFFPGPGLLLMAVGVGLVDPQLGQQMRAWVKSKLEKGKGPHPPT